MTEVTSAIQLNPKKFLMKGSIHHNSSYTAIEISVFQDISTSTVCQEVLDMLAEVLDLEGLKAKCPQLFLTWRTDPELTLLKKPRIEIVGNGAQCPSCTVRYKEYNEAFQREFHAHQEDEQYPHPAYQQWTVNFSYKKGKWEDLYHINGHSNFNSGTVSYDDANEVMRRLQELRPELR